MKTWGSILFAVSLQTFAVLGQGTILWDESVNGEFSRDFHFPNSLATLQIGTNTITGKTENVPTPPNWGVYPDYFNLQILNGYTVNAIYLQVDKPDVWNWIGNTSFSAELAFVRNPTSGELLYQWGVTHLGPGNYGMYLANLDSQTTTSIANYRLDFVVQVVPEPSTLAISVAGGVCFLSLYYMKTRKTGTPPSHLTALA